MKGDFTRWTHSLVKNYSAVLLQQGRVLLDADWNEQREIDGRSRRALTRDLIGAAAGPAEGAGFAVAARDDDGDGLREALYLEAGRYYVDGLACELHADTPIADQPDLAGLDPTAELEPGRYAVYLDVWGRHVTHIEDPEIKEKALGGVDHTSREQLVSQARLLSLDDLEADECELLHDPEALAALIEGPRGRLAASVDPAPESTDPCVVPPSAGFRGLENQLYRVEIHKPGDDGSVTFKWSRDNGSVVTAWAAHPDPAGEPEIIEVADLGPDEARGFRTPDLLVELVDDALQLEPGPGLLAKIAAADEASRTLELRAPVDAQGDPVALTNIARADDARHPRVRRWDCSRPRRIDEVDESDGAHDWIELEDGVRVRFDFSGGRRFRAGDYWLIPARTVDGSIAWEPEGLQAPHGVEHRYACLAVVELDEDGAWTVERSCRRHFAAADAQVHLRYVGGDGQQGVLGQPAPAPLRVQVLNGALPLAGAELRFELLDSGSDGSLLDLASSTSGDAITVETDADGLARVRFTLASEEALADEPSLVDQRVRATLLDECGAATKQELIFSIHESQAAEVRYDPTTCPAMQELHAAGHESDHVQAALEILCGNPELDYAGGDGQEAMPGEELPAKLAVRVGNGAFPFEGVEIRFTLVDLDSGEEADDEAWAGALVPDAPASSVEASWASGDPRILSVRSDARGRAWVRWRLGESPEGRPGVRARIVLPEPYDLFAPGEFVDFVGRWSLAERVAYSPTCEHLVEAEVRTVQDALDALCSDRTLYYVGGDGQLAEWDTSLRVPLSVRVANEGQAIAGARVRFEIVEFGGGSLDPTTGGELDEDGPGVVDAAAWSGSSRIRRVLAETDEAGLARVRWRYAEEPGDALPGVRATLLDAEGALTPSHLVFAAVPPRPAGTVEEDEGVRVHAVLMRDRHGFGRRLFNDSTVDPHHLLEGVELICDRKLDEAAVVGKGTTQLRLEVPYGWYRRPGAKLEKPEDPYFAAEGVQHYDEEIVAGEVRVGEGGERLIWAPTSAARRMLVSDGVGPLRTRVPGLPLPLPPGDWPLPARLLAFGGGAQRVRACVTAEGNFVLDARRELHLDGETLGALRRGDRVGLQLPSGDGRAGGDFRSWFWLEGRIWSKVVVDVPVEVPIESPGFTIAPGPLETVVGYVRVIADRLELGWYSASLDELVRQQTGEGLPPQRPEVWAREQGGVPRGYWVGYRGPNNQPRALQVAIDGSLKHEFDDDELELDPAELAPAGTQTEGGFAMTWIDPGQRLRALVFDGSEFRKSLPSANAQAEFVGRPSALFDRETGELHLLCQADDGDPALFLFSYRPEANKWSQNKLSAKLEGWKPAADGHICASAGLDERGRGVLVMAWRDAADTLVVVHKRGGRGWVLERPRSEVEFELEPEHPLTCAIDGRGVTHILAVGRTHTRDKAGLIDLWTDARTPWTLSDPGARLGLQPLHPGLSATVSGGGAHLVVAAPDRSEPEGLLRLAYFGPPVQLGPPPKADQALPAVFEVLAEKQAEAEGEEEVEEEEEAEEI